jgi:hypothetical protein
VIAAGVEPVDHGDISEYVPLIRHDEIDLIFSHSIGALPSPFPLRLLLEERVHQVPPQAVPDASRAVERVRYM